MQTTGRENLERRSDRPSRDIEQKIKHTQLNAACLSETAKRKLSPCVRIKHACVREKKELLYGLKLDKTYQVMLIKQRTSLHTLFPRWSALSLFCFGGVQV